MKNLTDDEIKFLDEVTANDEPFEYDEQWIADIEANVLHTMSSTTQPYQNPAGTAQPIPYGQANRKEQKAVS